MNCIKKLIKKYLLYYENAKNIEINGRLEVKKSGITTEYYQTSIQDNIKIRKYIKKNDVSFIKKLSQKSYNAKIKKIAEKRLKILRKLENFDEYELENIYDNLPNERKKFVTPIFSTYNQILNNWNNSKYIINEMNPEQKIFYTKKGEYVRSKSEKILADMFYDLNIPYKYECQLILRNGYEYYPDFTFISPYTYEEIYWEHFGMMDDEKYSQKALRKINIYYLNGIKEYDNFIVSMESKVTPLNFKKVEEIAKMKLLK